MSVAFVYEITSLRITWFSTNINDRRVDTFSVHVAFLFFFLPCMSISTIAKLLPLDLILLLSLLQQRLFQASVHDTRNPRRCINQQSTNRQIHFQVERGGEELTNNQIRPITSRQRPLDLRRTILPLPQLDYTQQCGYKRLHGPG